MPEVEGDSVSADPVFDASQYDFFGKNIVDGVELGGLEDGDDEYLCVGDINGQFSELESDEVRDLGSLSDADDLVGTFSKLNRVATEPRNVVCSSRNSVSRDEYAFGEWGLEAESLKQSGQQFLDADSIQEDKQRLLQPYPSYSLASQSKTLYRTSTYPQEPIQKPHHITTDPVPVPKLSCTLPIGQIETLPCHQLPSQSPSSHNGFSMLPSARNVPPFPDSQHHMLGLRHGSHSGRYMPQFGPGGSHLSRQPQKQWMNQANPLCWDSTHTHNLLSQRLPCPDDLMASHMLHQEHQNLHQIQPLPRFSNYQSQYCSSRPFPPQILNKIDTGFGMSHSEDQRYHPQRGIQGRRYFHLGFDSDHQRNDNSWPQFRAKYMSPDEIDNILRMQLAATHSNDPYIDDYYHQACLAKRTAGTMMKHHFCPTSIGDLSSRSRANSEPHPYLQVDALGRLPFSSIRRPRPLLEVDPPSSTDTDVEQKSSITPLDQEPMLAARIMIEDGLSVLLDVNDIDRMLLFHQLPDGGLQLKHKRQALLEGLATSLQLVDPLGPIKAGSSVPTSKDDDYIFLLVISLNKGRNLLSQYLQLLHHDNELIRVVCMAIFRHLTSLFGVLPPDSGDAKSVVNLAQTICSCVNVMDLSLLSACLAAVVSSSEQPPLRPLGSSAGYGASIVVKSVLERSKNLLTDIRTSSNCTMESRSLWQASFDAFFKLLMKYCRSKCDFLLQALLLQTPNMPVIGQETLEAIRAEMPVEVLNSCIPHTTAQQRFEILDFIRVSVPKSGYNASASRTSAMA